jgi:hypothetical protein
MAVGKAALGKVEDITRAILVLRGRRALLDSGHKAPLDSDLGGLYQVETRAPISAEAPRAGPGKSPVRDPPESLLL